jgi:cysteine-rich repeat protein
MFHVCGNGKIGQAETCDDENAITGDGCSDVCDREACFSCTAGEPSVCSPIPGCTATCVNGAAIADTAIMTFQGMTAPSGRQSYKLKGKILAPPVAAGEYDPSAEGLEVVITSTGLVHGLFAPAAIPPGPPGTGCGPRDGWKKKVGASSRAYTYKNASGALPPDCVPASARGLRSVKLRDRIATGGGFEFDFKVAKTTLGATPSAPLMATVVLGQGPAVGLAGRCGRIVFSTAIGFRFFP